jgi:uncharacterized protein (TIGR03435 family)
MRLKIGICVLLAAPAAIGQPSRPSFEVASVRAWGAITSKGADEAKRGGGMQVGGARVDASMMSLADVVQQAYDLKPFQFSGPGWMSSERYDIHAKLPAGATPDQVPAMLQNLLAERFKLAFHRESREHAVYALTVAKNGLKLRLAEGRRDQKMVAVEGAFHVDRDMTMAELCNFLGRFVDRPVVDLTDLTATYQVTFDIPTDELKRAKMAAEGARVTESAPDPSGGSMMFASVQQLGLRLEPRKMAIDFLVVDHAERVPTEN